MKEHTMDKNWYEMNKEMQKLIANVFRLLEKEMADFVTKR